MEKNKQDLAGWVDARMASLDTAGDWRPDTTRAWNVLRRRDRTRRASWVGATAAAMAAGLVLLALGDPRACANPLGCANANEEQAKTAAPELLTNFRESGAPNAKVTIEVYSDYQCPSCAQAFTSGIIPQLVKE